MKLTKETYDMILNHSISMFRCDIGSIHGIGHWKNVERNGLIICREVGADDAVVRLFAILHDCCRRDDGKDIRHGSRAARMIKQGDLLKGLITEEQLNKLAYALARHTTGFRSDDATIGACWDADRLDLDRVGIKPSAFFMSTETGRRIANNGGIEVL